MIRDKGGPRVRLQPVIEKKEKQIEFSGRKKDVIDRRGASKKPLYYEEKPLSWGRGVVPIDHFRVGSAVTSPKLLALDTESLSSREIKFTLQVEHNFNPQQPPTSRPTSAST